MNLSLTLYILYDMRDACKGVEVTLRLEDKSLWGKGGSCHGHTSDVREAQYPLPRH